jgi:hypothetical protein
MIIAVLASTAWAQDASSLGGGMGGKGGKGRKPAQNTEQRQGQTEGRR